MFRESNYYTVNTVTTIPILFISTSYGPALLCTYCRMKDMIQAWGIGRLQTNNRKHAHKLLYIIYIFDYIN